MDEAKIISQAMGILGSKKTRKKRASSIANLQAARAAGKTGGWPKGKPRKPQK